MSLLFKHLRIHQIFGANTDVGKTILTTALVRASAQRKKRVFYLKPVSTGALQEADDHHVRRYTAQFPGLVHSDCLFRYNEPVSPHLAATLYADGQTPEVPSDNTFVNTVADRLTSYGSNSSTLAHVYVETAGGVHSPALSGTTQADCYRPLFLPTILIGDSRLGGISSTISSYESLLLRGYQVEAVLLFQDEYYRNGEYLKPYFEEKGILVATVDPPPPRLSDPHDNFATTDRYYAKVTQGTSEGSLTTVVNQLDNLHACRLQELESLPRRALHSFWWPFVQHGLIKSDKEVTVIDSAYQDFFSVTNKPALHDMSSTDSVLSPQFDGSASWWTQTFGHAHPSLTLAAARASGRYGHVMFPQAVHLPALNLAERLIKGPGKGWASKAFFSDNGSTGMEVAIKMALRAYTLRHGKDLSAVDKKQLGILGLKGSYHGDTIGAMDASEEGVYTCEWHEAKGYWLDPPSIGIKDGKVTITVPSSLAGFSSPHHVQAKSLSWVYNVEDRLHTPLASAYAKYIQRVLDSVESKQQQRLAALVIEPIIMGAGGMIFVDPLFQRVLVDTVRGRRSGKSSQWSGLPVIFDEVFVGLNRVGVESTTELLGTHPDISVNAKILTGGLIPLSVTLASQSIFDAFVSEGKADALLHGHSYTAHPIGCEVANETFAMIDKLQTTEEWSDARANWLDSEGKLSKAWSFWDPNFINAVSKLPNVREVMTLGTVLAIKVHDPAGGYVSHSAQTLLKSLSKISSPYELSAAPGGAPYSVHYRTLGDVAYFMTSLNTKPSVIRAIEDRIWETLAAA